MNEPLESKLNGFAFDPASPLTVTMDELMDSWEQLVQNYRVSETQKKLFERSIVAIGYLDDINAGTARYSLYITIISANSNRDKDRDKTPVQPLLDIASKIADIAERECNNRFPFVKLEECVLKAGARHLRDKYAFMETIINEIEYLLTHETGRRSERAH